MNGQENEIMGLNEIIAMGHEARLCDKEGCDDASIIITDHMTRFAKLVAAKYETALADYIQHVRDCEGTDFISDIDWLDNKTSVEIIKAAAK